MSIKIVSVKCPDCGASLEIEDDRKQAFCAYCGAKIILNNENEYIYRHIDEAGIKQAETDRIVKLKQLDIAERKRKTAQKMNIVKIILLIITAIAGALMAIVGWILGDTTGNEDSAFYYITFIGVAVLFAAGYNLFFSIKKDNVDEYSGDKVKVPSSVFNYKKKSYTAIEALFRGAGFTNIQCIPLNDLTTGFLKKPGTVDSVTINGNEIAGGENEFPPDALVVISYHNLSR